jgi:hypothetical protein
MSSDDNNSSSCFCITLQEQSSSLLFLYRRAFDVYISSRVGENNNTNNNVLNIIPILPTPSQEENENEHDFTPKCYSCVCEAMWEEFQLQYNKHVNQQNNNNQLLFPTQFLIPQILLADKMRIHSNIQNNNNTLLEIARYNVTESIHSAPTPSTKKENENDNPFVFVVVVDLFQFCSFLASRTKIPDSSTMEDAQKFLMNFVPLFKKGLHLAVASSDAIPAQETVD